MNRSQIKHRLLGDGFASEILKDTFDSEGERKITIRTLSERGETINVSTVRPTIYEVIGEHYFDPKNVSF